MYAGGYLFVVYEHITHLVFVLIGEFHLIFDRDSLKFHLVLRKSSRFISQNVSNSPKLFWYIRISGNSSLYHFIIVYTVRVE